MFVGNPPGPGGLSQMKCNKGLECAPTKYLESTLETFCIWGNHSDEICSPHMGPPPGVCALGTHPAGEGITQSWWLILNSTFSVDPKCLHFNSQFLPMMWTTPQLIPSASSGASDAHTTTSLLQTKHAKQELQKKLYSILSLSGRLHCFSYSKYHLMTSFWQGGSFIQVVRRVAEFFDNP